MLIGGSGKATYCKQISKTKPAHPDPKVLPHSTRVHANTRVIDHNRNSGGFAQERPEGKQ